MADAAAINPQLNLMLLARQAGVLVGVAAAVALGLYVALWARTPEFTLLNANLDQRDLSDMIAELQKTGLTYRMDARGSGILVPADKIDEARARLAAAGLPRTPASGIEQISEAPSFGISQNLEQARLHQVIESELAKSIATISNVRSARVHLAIPRPSAFARLKQQPSASVVVDLYQGRPLEPNQVAAITQMVSAAVAGLVPEQVTVVDGRGNLLTDGRDGRGNGDSLLLSAKRLDYTRHVEQSYIDRVESLLAPMVGLDGVRAQVTADIDFTDTEKTSETFNPDTPAVRSQSSSQEERSGDAANGVPGALSNTPPGPATAPEQTAAAAGANGQQPAPATPSNKRTQTTTNNELDHHITHTKPMPGNLRRISVAVMVRNPVAPAAPVTEPKPAEGADANAEQKDEAATADKPAEAPAAEAPKAPVKPVYSAEDIERMTNMVKVAVGFSAERGDIVTVTPVDFHTPEPLVAPPEVPLWKQPWVWNVGKQVLGGLFVLFVLFGVIRPTVKNLMTKPLTVAGSEDGVTIEGGAIGANGELAALPPGEGGQHPALPGTVGLTPAQQLLASTDVDPNIESVKQFVNADPRIAAQVIKGWVGE